MAKKRNSALSIFFALLLIVFVVGWGYSFIKNDNRTFYVQRGSTQISKETSDITLQRGAYSLFYVKSLSSLEAPLYAVKVLPNPAINQEISSGGASIQFSKLSELTSAFAIIKETDFFAVYIPKDATLQSIVQTVYPGAAVADINLSEKDFFLLQVTNIATGDKVAIAFNIGGTDEN